MGKSRKEIFKEAVKKQKEMKGSTMEKETEKCNKPVVNKDGSKIITVTDKTDIYRLVRKMVSGKYNYVLDFKSDSAKKKYDEIMLRRLKENPVKQKDTKKATVEKQTQNKDAKKKITEQNYRKIADSVGIDPYKYEMILKHYEFDSKRTKYMFNNYHIQKVFEFNEKIENREVVIELVKVTIYNYKYVLEGFDLSFIQKNIRRDNFIFDDGQTKDRFFDWCNIKNIVFAKTDIIKFDEEFFKSDITKSDEEALKSDVEYEILKDIKTSPLATKSDEEALKSDVESEIMKGVKTPPLTNLEEYLKDLHKQFDFLKDSYKKHMEAITPIEVKMLTIAEVIDRLEEIK